MKENHFSPIVNKEFYSGLKKADKLAKNFLKSFE